MKNKNDLFISLISIVIGVLFIILKGSVINIAMTVLGVILIVLGITNIVDKKCNTNYGIFQIIIGAIIIIAGWFIAKVVLYILAVMLVVYGIYKIYLLTQIKGAGILSYLAPILEILTGILLLFNQGGTIDWVFIVVGIMMVVEGFIGAISSFNN